MTYYVEIRRKAELPERWRCGFVEPRYGALVMSGEVRHVPPEAGDVPAAKVVIPFSVFESARIDYRDDTVD